MDDDILLLKRLHYHSSWSSGSVENLSSFSDKNRGRSRIRKHRCLSWLGMYIMVLNICTQYLGIDH